MRKQLLLAGLLAVAYSGDAQNQEATQEIGNLVVRNIPALPADLMERVDQYQNVRGATVADWDREGKGLFISTRFAEVPQIHHVAAPGADRRQITFYKEPLAAAAVAPDKKQNGFVFSRDNGGNENYQIYFFDLSTGRARLLTDGKSRNQFQGWNRAGSQLAYMSNQRNGADLDLYLLNFQPEAKPTLLTELKGGGWGVSAWSDDGKQMILSNYKSINEAELYRFDVASRKLERLFATAGPVSYSGAEFTKDGKGLFLVSDEGTEFQTLRYVDLASKQQAPLTAPIPWDVQGMDLSKDGTKLVFATNEDGYSKLYMLDTKTRKYQPVANVPKGVISNFRLNDDSRRLALSVSTPTASSDVYVADLTTKTLTRWTTSELGGLNSANFVEPSLIQYSTFDQVDGQARLIPAFLYKPKNATGKTPVLISIHGGPEGQSLPTFSPLINLLVNELGIAVVVPNVRGSSGYGKTYLKLDNGAKREESVKDIGALLEWIGRQPDLDPGRVAVYGGSYGGYMSLATMTNYNDQMRCGIDLFGISNFTTFLKNTSPYRADLRRAEYGDERDPAMQAIFAQISPISKIKNITKPMLVYQGKNDPRVPLSESEQMVAGLQQQGTSVWYIMAKDEGHSLAKKANRDYTYGAMLLFLRNNLLK
ncbi:prolyl oligopeptidase family serine peptidase [Microvirga sp. STR05]|uniref:Prolyl oligopeptidase family serine peptidase n=1 Tax=Hymenobacter duratus TaxID=2771356 RepID=A0ABR8JFS9_9BACT|nr:prolyl oligopeptidase family serine peptidase [Hymenobacter duratus]MBD2714942.1 prolyl oligopeptidase family serine peptidase [Hymenobacter duratus]MBR7949848.1 prolyl oligopeptidase family serine peptidase [Microvirga sp. STR05]